MARVFNTSGPCSPEKHHMLPAEERLSEARRLIDLERYFVLHAPRQTGKTTTVAALTESLNREERYTALLASCEEAQAVGEDINRAVAIILIQIVKAAADLPEALRPPPVDSVAEVDGASRLGSYLTLWAEGSPRPVVLFLDEIDSMMGKPLISVLRQLRAGYRYRPARFPQSVVLIGMRDVRDYKIAKGEVLHTASPY
ncbi:MAG: ATP-binding protein, partial [bacterium]|nr:ATP-binding protein [bacterium]